MRTREDGIALLVVLLTITLLTVVVVEFTYSSQVETHLALSGRNALQATYLARSGVNIAEAILLRDAKTTDSEQDLWARPLPPLPVGDGTVALRVRDEARALNVNDLVSGGFVREERRLVFERLFDLLGVDQRILAAIVDWIDPDQEPWVSPTGAEQPYYLGLTPPVEVRNGPLVTLRELLLVRGITPSLLARLDGFVTVLPRQDRLSVNVNTAPPEVLYALSAALTAEPGIVDRLLAARRENPFSGRRELRERHITGLNEALDSGGGDFIDTKSAYFRIQAVGAVNDVARGILTTVRRETLGLRITRLSWAPSTANLSLTSQPASDFLEALPPLGGG
jgi:general secretion pathway protein K